MSDTFANILPIAFDRQRVNRAIVPSHDFCDWTLRDQLSVIKNNHTVAHSLHIIEDVGGIENGRVLAQALHHFQDIAASHRVERGCRFVENQKVGVVDLSLSDAKPLALTTRETFDGAVSFVRQSDEIKRFRDALFNRFLRTAVKKAGGEVQGLARGHVIVIAWVLRQISHALADGDAVTYAVHPKDLSVSTCWARQPKQELDGGAFARAIGTEEAADGVLAYLQIEWLKSLNAFIRFAQSLRIDDITV